MRLKEHADIASLRGVLKELSPLLGEVRQAIEHFTEHSAETDPLALAIIKLRQAQGTLNMVELYGAGSVAGEMANTLTELAKEGLANNETKLEVLMRAAMQLPDYLERIRAGSKDVPLALLPLLNDLRSVRKQRLLTERDLFFPVLDLDTAADVRLLLENNQGQLLQDAAKQGHSKFQLQLLEWIRAPKRRSLLVPINDFLAQLTKIAESQTCKRFFTICAALCQSFLDGGIEPSDLNKPLFGKIERIVREIAEHGELDFIYAVPLDLVRAMLYEVGISKSPAARVQAVKGYYQLDEQINSRNDAVRAQDVLAGPNIELLEAVTGSIKEDIAEVKDAIEVYVHGGERTISQLQPVEEILLRISDTLGMLGVVNAQQMLSTQLPSLRTLVSTGGSADEEALLKVASVLLTTEGLLDDFLKARSELIVEPVATHDSSELHLAELPDADSRDVLSAVVREALRDMAKAREALLVYFAGSDEYGQIDAVPSVLGQVHGAMIVLSLDQLASLIAKLIRYVQSNFVDQRRYPEVVEQTRVADTVASIEFFLESLEHGQANAEQVLEVAEHALEDLQNQLLVPLDDGNIQAVLSQDDTGLHEAIELDSITPCSVNEAADKVATAPMEANAERSFNIIGDQVDDEILSVFIEEAVEELERINNHLPRWKQDPSAEESLVTMRRSYHTLKGSGRLIGAELIGEFAWSMENLLNRLIDGAIDLSQDVLSTLDQASAILPKLIEQLRGDREPVAGIAELIASAHQLSKGSLQQFADAGYTELRSALDAEDSALGEASGDSDPVVEAMQDTELSMPAIPDTLEEEIKQFLELTEQSVEPNLSEELEFSIAPETEVQAASITEHASSAEHSQAPSLDGDQVLLDIFSSEAQEHLQHIQRVLNEAQVRGGDVTISDELMRHVHTLHGSAETADIASIAAVSGALERLTKTKLEHDGKLNHAELDVVRGSTEAIQQAVNDLMQTSQVADTYGLDNFRERLETLRTAAEVELSRQHLPPDQELLEIFIDEGDELLDSSDRLLSKWRDAAGNREYLADLQRNLHTLKGSARMAGLMPIADLSHSLESLLATVESEPIDPTEELFSLMQEAIDALTMMVEQARHLKPVRQVEWLLKDIEQYRSREPGLLIDEEELGVVLPSAPDLEAQAPAAQLDLDEAPTEHPAEEDWPKQAEPADQPLTSPSVVLPESVMADVPEAPSPQPAVSGEPSQNQRLAQESLETLSFAEARGVEPMRVEVGTQVAEQIRVRAELLEELVNYAGEVNIFQSRLGQQVGDYRFNLAEFEQTVRRVRTQLRTMDMETEAQILYRHQRDGDTPTEFDPLELDRYSHIQELSRALAESVDDLDSIRVILQDLTRDSELMLLQQSRIGTELHEGLMRTRMVRFDGLAARLGRVVRQTAQSVNKKAELEIIGGGTEIDRSVQERFIAPLEHMLRNAVAHGIELPQQREQLGKPEVGLVRVSLERDGTDIVITVSDDGAGIDIEAVRAKAVAQQIIDDDAKLSEQELLQLILQTGFSTARELTQVSGRGVGMDVVDTEVKQLSGSLRIHSMPGKGTRFVTRLPLTLAINEAVLVDASGDTYALPVAGIEGVTQVALGDLQRYYLDRNLPYEYASMQYEVHHLATLLRTGAPRLADADRQAALIMTRAGDYRVALHVDGLVGRREVVVKPVGPQASAIDGISGATILGDGRVVLILDIASLMRAGAAEAPSEPPPVNERTAPNVRVLVVDDSITIRKVTARMLERHNMQVVTAKDGVDAVAALGEGSPPDVLLLDIEMPRMDGYEVAAYVRGDERLKRVPIIMITSRTGEKHRERALELGVNRYLGKPYNESELLGEINHMLQRRTQLR